MKSTLEKIAVMQAYVDGKPLETKETGSEWYDMTHYPSWDWTRYDYRIAVTKPSINWDHVSEEYNWMATDDDGISYLYGEEPTIGGHSWREVDYAQVSHSSFKPGTCDWKDSLVKRGE